MSVESESFLKADECPAGLFQVEEGFSCVQEGGETLSDSIGGTGDHHRSRAPLDGAQGGTDVQEHGQHAGTEKNPDGDRDVDGLRCLFRGGQNGLQGGLLLGLNLADDLQGEVRQTGFVIVCGLGSGSDNICRSDGGGRKKHNDDAG